VSNNVTAPKNPGCGILVLLALCVFMAFTGYQGTQDGPLIENCFGDTGCYKANETLSNMHLIGMAIGAGGFILVSLIGTFALVNYTNKTREYATSLTHNSSPSYSSSSSNSNQYTPPPRSPLSGSSQQFSDPYTPTPPVSQSPIKPPTAASSLESELAKLNDLKAKGLIEDEEYKTLRQNLINRS